ncbi:MAG: metallophosphoesterase family protein [Desulfobacterales bacterium]
MLEKIQAKNNYFVGVISDTHGRLPQSVSKVFKNTDLIIHAGDIGNPDIIEALEKIAPTRAVRGNMDMGQWARQLRQNETITINNQRLYVIHDIYKLNIRAQSDTYRVVICGHTHRPQMEKQQGILYLNPGSAVQPRFGYPPSVALLEIKGEAIRARMIDLSS